MGEKDQYNVHRLFITGILRHMDETELYTLPTVFRHVSNLCKDLKAAQVKDLFKAFAQNNS